MGAKLLFFCFVPIPVACLAQDELQSMWVEFKLRLSALPVTQHAAMQKDLI